MVAEAGDGFRLDAIVEVLAPTGSRDPALREAFSRLARMAMGPGGLPAMVGNLGGTDITAILPSIPQPTIFIGRADDDWYPPALGRWLAERVPGARFVEIPGRDTLLFGPDFELLADEVQDFLTGDRPPPFSDRILATVLFTDIVGSTETAARLGDSAWRELLDRHDELIRRNLRRFRGEEVKTTGDGFMATFDGPARAIRCGQAIAEAARSLGIEVRAGVHTGECELRGQDLSGLAVHVAARVSALAAAGEVLVSQTVHDLVAGSGLSFVDRGEHRLRGVPNPTKVLAVAG